MFSQNLKIRDFSMIKYNCFGAVICGWTLFLISFIAPPSYGQAGSTEAEMICWWSFDKDSENSVLDEVGDEKDPAYGNIEYVPGISGNAIKLDGFGSYIKRNQNAARPAGAFTVESWIAVAS